MTTPREKLSQLLHEQCRLGEQLLSSGELITVALRDAAHEQLEAQLVVEKELLAALDESGQHLNEFLLTTGQNADSSGLKTALAKYDNDGSLKRQWRHLRKVLTRCRDSNHSNRVIAQQGQRYSQEALLLLSGANRRSAATYDASGVINQALGGRNLGAA